jgi:hypothetical protein
MHPHVIGVPHRLYYLEKALDLLSARQDAVFMTSSEIADWFLAEDKNGRQALQAASQSRPG